MKVRAKDIIDKQADTFPPQKMLEPVNYWDLAQELRKAVSQMGDEPDTGFAMKALTQAIQWLEILERKQAR